jgi:hypothetical protein
MGYRGLLRLRDLTHKPKEILFGNAFIAKKSLEKSAPKIQYKTTKKDVTARNQALVVLVRVA